MLYRRVRRNTVFRWAIASSPSWTRPPSAALRASGAADALPLRRPGVRFRAARSRLVLLDYDGTSSLPRRVRAMRSPARGGRSRRRLAAAPASPPPSCPAARARTWTPLRNVPDLWLIGEHGGWRALAHHARMGDGASPARDEWKSASCPCSSTFIDRTPGSFLEEKELALVCITAWPIPSSENGCQRVVATLDRDAGRDGAAGHRGTRRSRCASPGQQGAVGRSLQSLRPDGGLPARHRARPHGRGPFPGLRGEAWTVRVGGRDVFPRAIPIDSPGEVIAFLESLVRARRGPRVIEEPPRRWRGSATRVASGGDECSTHPKRSRGIRLLLAGAVRRWRQSVNRAFDGVTIRRIVDTGGPRRPCGSVRDRFQRALRLKRGARRLSPDYPAGRVSFDGSTRC